MYCAQVLRTFFLALPLLNSLSLTETLFARATTEASFSKVLSVSLSDESVESPVHGPLWISEALWIQNEIDLMLNQIHIIQITELYGKAGPVIQIHKSATHVCCIHRADIWRRLLVPAV